MVLRTPHEPRPGRQGRPPASCRCRVHRGCFSGRSGSLGFSIREDASSVSLPEPPLAKLKRPGLPAPQAPFLLSVSPQHVSPSPTELSYLFRGLFTPDQTANALRAEMPLCSLPYARCLEQCLEQSGLHPLLGVTSERKKEQAEPAIPTPPPAGGRRCARHQALTRSLRQDGECRAHGSEPSS